ncbi:MAG: hypothetical protein AAFX92_02245 [Pseudomonadota bacterium]
MPLNVGNQRSETATIIVEDGKVTEVGVEGPKGSIGIGNASSVSAEFKDIVGGKLDADDVRSLFEALTLEKKGLAGVDNVELVGLTNDAFTVKISGFAGPDGPYVDTVTFEVGEEFFKSIEDDSKKRDVYHDVGDKNSGFHIIDTDAGEAIQGSRAGGIKDLIGGVGRGQDDVTALLEAALDPDDDRVKLVGLENDNFAIQIFGTPKGVQTVDTFIFTGTQAEQAIAELATGNNARNIDADDKKVQTLVVGAGLEGGEEAEGAIVGQGTSGDYFTFDGDGIGSTLKIDELQLLADTADERETVNVIDQGDTLRLELDPTGDFDGTGIDIIVVSEDLLLS